MDRIPGVRHKRYTGLTATNLVTDLPSDFEGVIAMGVSGTGNVELYYDDAGNKAMLAKIDVASAPSSIHFPFPFSAKMGDSGGVLRSIFAKGSAAGTIYAIFYTFVNEG